MSDIRQIHQFVPSFAARDAIGANALNVRQILRGAGYESEIFSEDIHPEMAKHARFYSDYLKQRRKGETAMLYHASTSSNLGRFVLAQDDPLVIYFHNITPATYFERWLPVAAQRMRSARQELKEFPPHTSLAIANSSYTEQELKELGFGKTDVVPVLVDLADLERAPNRRTLDRLKHMVPEGSSHWLFVGRLAPNKCQHDLISAFAVYRNAFDPNARLSLVGGAPSDLYLRALETLIERLGIADAVTLAQSIPASDLLAYYAAADVFVCMSEHEGFCVPVIEAMHLGVPVVAYAASALPETVGDAGFLLDGKDPLTVAVAVRRVMEDEALRSTMIDAGRKQAQTFSYATTAERLLTALRGAFADSHA